ncbi:mitotic-spindle organizing protein 1 [Ctenocephalides felis]|uniref:mitotic-spindle organizing protein 1 n=1 Tax=Ctenocephalides felis TaxID=7515 RepID=UPI000E6E1E54|nr:mitotic-spindle organizing protein 1 [Ctenocephalides felis]
MSSNSSQTDQIREAYDTLYEISRLLNTGLTPETLQICIRLCEAGVNPEALAHVLREIRIQSETHQKSDANN